MESLILLGIILGLAGGIALSAFVNKKKSSQQVQQQSVLLLDKIKQVCKLITVEGEFSELFAHRDEKKYLFQTPSIRKKGLNNCKSQSIGGFRPHKNKHRNKFKNQRS
jgi:hypothetical protein